MMRLNLARSARLRPRPPPLELKGYRFGKLTAIERVGKVGTHYVWRCICDCGKETTVPGTRLKGGSTSSCGCGRADYCRRTKTTHGATRDNTHTPEYKSWARMLSRCRSPSQRPKGYQARGIQVCSRWRGLDGFANFLEDMGPKPSAIHSIDRYPDGEGGYAPGNCRWATPKQQAQNRRTTRWIEIDGQRMTVTDAAAAYGIQWHTAFNRLNAGWTVEQTFKGVPRA
jgi:hypothetical protein